MGFRPRWRGHSVSTAAFLGKDTPKIYDIYRWTRGYWQPVTRGYQDREQAIAAASELADQSLTNETRVVNEKDAIVWQSDEDFDD